MVPEVSKGLRKRKIKRLLIPLWRSCLNILIQVVASWLKCHRQMEVACKLKFLTLDLVYQVNILLPQVFHFIWCIDFFLTASFRCVMQICRSAWHALLEYQHCSHRSLSAQVYPSQWFQSTWWIQLRTILKLHILKYLKVSLLSVRHLDLGMLVFMCKSFACKEQ